MTNRIFSVTVGRITEETKAKMHAVLTESVKDVYEILIKSWPIDTGWSSYSWTVSTIGWAPTSPPPKISSQDRRSDPTRPNRIFFYDLGEINASVDAADIGDTIYGNFRAEYAPHVSFQSEKGTGLVRGAVSNWQSIVASNAARISARDETIFQG